MKVNFSELEEAFGFPLAIRISCEIIDMKDLPAEVWSGRSIDDYVQVCHHAIGWPKLLGVFRKHIIKLPKSFSEAIIRIGMHSSDPRFLLFDFAQSAYSFVQTFDQAYELFWMLPLSQEMEKATPGETEDDLKENHILRRQIFEKMMSLITKYEREWLRIRNNSASTSRTTLHLSKKEESAWAQKGLSLIKTPQDLILVAELVHKIAGDELHERARALTATFEQGIPFFSAAVDAGRNNLAEVLRKALIKRTQTARECNQLLRGAVPVSTTYEELVHRMKMFVIEGKL